MAHDGAVFAAVVDSAGLRVEIEIRGSFGAIQSMLLTNLFSLFEVLSLGATEDCHTPDAPSSLFVC